MMIRSCLLLGRPEYMTKTMCMERAMNHIRSNPSNLSRAFYSTQGVDKEGHHRSSSSSRVKTPTGRRAVTPCTDFDGNDTHEEREEGDFTRRRLDVAIVGRPNAGKSQMLNRLCGAPVAAVSRKRHTTRDSSILGVVTREEVQVVFVDTPGFVTLHDRHRERADVQTPVPQVYGADYTLLVVDAASRLGRDGVDALLSHAIRSHGSLGGLGVVLNKVDRVKHKPDLLDLTVTLGSMALKVIDAEKAEVSNDSAAVELKNMLERMSSESDDYDNDDVNKYLDNDNEGPDPEDPNYLVPTLRKYPQFFYTDALHGDGVDDVLQYLLDLARTVPFTAGRDWHYGADETSSLSATPLELCTEILREKIYRTVHREVPHKVRQVNRSFRTFRRPDDNQRWLHIEQDFLVSTESHRRILSRTETLKRIEEQAVRDIGKALNCKVVMRLQVRKTNKKNNRGGSASSNLVATTTLPS